MESYSVEQTSDNGYIIGGQIWEQDDENDIGVYNDVALLKVDANGDKQWLIESDLKNHDDFQIAHQTSDNGYIVAGFQKYGAGGFLLKVDENGNTEWNNNL